MPEFEDADYDWSFKTTVVSCRASPPPVLACMQSPGPFETDGLIDGISKPIAKPSVNHTDHIALDVEEEVPVEARNIPKRIYLLTVVACLVNFTVGFAMAIIAPALIFIEDSLNASIGEISAIVSFALLGGLVGSILSGWSSDLVGRRLTMSAGAVIMGISSLACALSRTSGQLIAARFFQGLGTSLSVVVAGVILTELSPTHIRGYLGSASQNFLAVGLIASGFTGYLMHYLIPTSECWRPMFMVAAVSGIVSWLLVLLLLEESPRWLISKNKTEDARQVLRKIYGDHNDAFIEQEIANLSSQNHPLAEIACFDMNDLFCSAHRRPLLLTCALKFIQQLTGTVVIVSYMVVIFSETGASREDALLFTALSSLPQLVTMVLGSYLLDLTGRKSLLLASQAGVIITLVFMGVFQFFDAKFKTGAMILGVILFRVFYSLGLGPIPLVLASEILPFKIRGRGLAISTLLHSILGFVLTASFPVLSRAIGDNLIYWGFAVISIGGYIFIQNNIDETSNIRLEELEARNHDHANGNGITFHVTGQPIRTPPSRSIDRST